MNKQVTAKRLLKRHNRHAASDKNWASTSKSNSRKPGHVAAAQTEATRCSPSLAESRILIMIVAGEVLFRAKCPRCRSIDFRTVGMRNVVERTLHRLLQPCRCSLCGRHFLVFRWQVPVSAMA